MGSIIDPVEPNAPQLLELRCNQGADLQLPITFYNCQSDGVTPDLTSPYDLTGYSFTGTVKESPANRAKTVIALTVTLLNQANGQIAVSLTNTQTDTLLQGEYYYDVKGSIGDFETYFLKGPFKVLGRATR